MKGCFVSATGTGVGKTVVSRALTLAARASGHSVAALKPIETGWTGEEGSDAAALAAAAGRPELARADGFYRAQPPLAPAAVTLAGGVAPPPPNALAEAVARAAEGFDRVVVEGAGGLLVPLDAQHTIADLVHALDLPLVLVAPDGLGVLSYVLTAAEAAAARGLRLRAVVLVQRDLDRDDPSTRSNRRLLAQRLTCPVEQFGRAPLADHDLGRFAEGQRWLPGLCD